MIKKNIKKTKKEELKNILDVSDAKTICDYYFKDIINDNSGGWVGKGRLFLIDIICALVDLRDRKVDGFKTLTLNKIEKAISVNGLLKVNKAINSPLSTLEQYADSIIKVDSENIKLESKYNYDRHGYTIIFVEEHLSKMKSLNTAFYINKKEDIFKFEKTTVQGLCMKLMKVDEK